MSEEQMIPMFQPNKTFVTEVRGTQYNYYLTGPIGAPEEYMDLCNILRSSSPQDEIIIRINSRGGFVSSERMIVNAIQESQANVKGFIEYDCMSAATGVFLACHSHGWGEHIQFMAHCSWWGAVGKNPDIKSQTEFGIKQMEEEIVSTYSGLLEDHELISCNEGKEFWFGAKELETRMIKYYEYKNSLPCDCGDESCPQNQRLAAEAQGDDFEDIEEFDLELLIQEKVDAALVTYDKKVKSAARKALKAPKPVEKVE